MVFNMTFSIIVVCLNAGGKLQQTIESILCQTEQDYEIIVKDGGSTDGSVEKLRDTWQADVQYESQSDQTKEIQGGARTPEKIRIYCQKDSGIYDAMNQALCHAEGDYVYFLNCGDLLADENVLARVKKTVERTEHGDIAEAAATGRGNGKKETTQEKSDTSVILYGNILEQKTGAPVPSNPVLDDFACYRNLPCHQACFYDRRLFDSRRFDTGYQVRADYEHFLWCLYGAKAKAVYMPFPVAVYEGGGFSESKAAKKKSKQEHREITAKYLPAGKVRKYRLIMLLTLAPLRTWLTEHPATARIYQRCKRLVYRG
jgi:glycosyltransferase involved in cell wall biosynthesis